jgi:2,4-dichlorophenol 6-monooxygenase
MTTIETDVLIVGAGPAGASSAVFLCRHGIANLVISRHRSTAESPRAHITNQRTMECLRDAGLEHECMAHASPPHFIEHSFWLRSIIGEELGRAYAWGNDPERKGDYESGSPCVVCDLPQTRLEPLLVADAARSGSQVRFSSELMSFEQDADGVTASIKDRLTGSLFTVRARYMIGADGARSRVVEQLGIPLTGEHGLGHAINVVCEIDLEDYVRYRHGSLYNTIQPGSSMWAPVGVARMVRPWDQWLIALIAPEAAGLPSPSAEDIEKRIREIVGDPAIPIKVLSTSWWTINDVVAERYSVGRVFCMGDAVHRHPPTNGLGSNTCIQDAFNLAWKLALVLQGKAAPGLLDSFDAERQPVGRQIVARANKSMGHNQRLWDLLGGGLRSVLSAEDHAAVFDTPEGRATLREMIDQMRYEYHAHGVEMNRHYVSQAIVDDDSAIPFDYKKDAELFYQPSTRPGAFLPHVWLGKRASGPRISTLDVAGKRRFTLFTGHGGDAWRDAAALAMKQLGVDINVTSVGPYLDFEDIYGAWRRLSGIDESGCVLVRPDLHIGWRSARIIDNPNAVLVDVMRTILALRPRRGVSSNG